MNYFSEPLSISSIPNFLTAESPRALRRKMLINNRKQKGYVHYFDITWHPDEKTWYAWYIVKVENELEQLNEGNE